VEAPGKASILCKHVLVEECDQFRSNSDARARESEGASWRMQDAAMKRFIQRNRVVFYELGEVTASSR
jgi:hypothetical protein